MAMVLHKDDFGRGLLTAMRKGDTVASSWTPT